MRAINISYILAYNSSHVIEKVDTGAEIWGN